MKRRKFLKRAGLLSLGTIISLSNCDRKNHQSEGRGNETTKKQDKSRVVEACLPQQFPLNQAPDPQKVEMLLNLALSKLFDVSDPREGLRELFSPQDFIGLKVNCLSGRKMSTHPQITWSLVKLLKKTGINDDKIIIWDRSNDDLKRAGYELNAGSGVKVYGADVSGYSSELLVHRSIGSFVAKIMEQVDKVISLPVLKDHGITGITLSLKNFFGAIHNPFKYHPEGGNPYIADLFSHPLFRGKVKLVIADGMVGQYEGGPPDQPQWQWNYGGVIAGTDPVAVDRIGLENIENMRKVKGLPSLAEVGRFPNYLRTAESLDLGNFNLEKIDLRQA